MVVENGVLIVSPGQILAAVQKSMMVIVLLVSNKSFQTMNEARSFIPTLKKSEFAIKLMNILKGSFMINPFTQVNATAQ
jgi:hypothetical protein